MANPLWWFPCNEYPHYLAGQTAFGSAPDHGRGKPPLVVSPGGADRLRGTTTGHNCAAQLRGTTPRHNCAAHPHNRYQLTIQFDGPASSEELVFFFDEPTERSVSLTALMTTIHLAEKHGEKFLTCSTTRTAAMRKAGIPDDVSKEIFTHSHYRQHTHLP